MEDSVQLAVNFFNQGYSCSQAVFSAFAPRFGIKRELAAKLASPFGGGIARQGETCGAVTGALLVLGLRYGVSSEESKDSIYLVSQQFLKLFDQKHKSIKCSQLIHFDLSQPEDLQLARQSGIFKQFCPQLVLDAAMILENMLAQSTKDQ